MNIMDIPEERAVLRDKNGGHFAPVECPNGVPDRRIIQWDFIPTVREYLDIIQSCFGTSEAGDWEAALLELTREFEERQRVQVKITSEFPRMLVLTYRIVVVLEDEKVEARTEMSFPIF